jgi:hypothetical protein
MDSANPFESLPNEVLYHLFSVLDAQLLSTVSQVCSGWRATADSSSLWAALFLERFISPTGEIENEEGHWRTRFVDSFRLLQTFEPAIQVGCLELKRVLDRDPAINAGWIKAGSNVCVLIVDFSSHWVSF